LFQVSGFELNEYLTAKHAKFFDLRGFIKHKARKTLNRALRAWYVVSSNYKKT